MDKTTYYFCICTHMHTKLNFEVSETIKPNLDSISVRGTEILKFIQLPYIEQKNDIRMLL